MENKYYTPLLKEFTVDFEYEFLNSKDEWKKSNDFSNEYDYEDSPLYGLQKDINNNKIRVKYLDASDAESLGFKKSLKSQWAGWDDYYTENLNAGRDYYLYATLHFPRGVTDLTRIEDNLFEIILHRFYKSDEHGTTEIEDCIEQRQSEVVFKGIIKNKSKLKEILELVGIETKSI
jgi:hypothetical protein